MYSVRLYKSYLLSYSNLWQLPLDLFGPEGIHIGDVVYAIFSRIDSRCQGHYDWHTKQITISTRSTLSPFILHSLLYQNVYRQHYLFCGWYPWLPPLYGEHTLGLRLLQRASLTEAERQVVEKLPTVQEMKSHLLRPEKQGVLEISYMRERQGKEAARLIEYTRAMSKQMQKKREGAVEPPFFTLLAPSTFVLQKGREPLKALEAFCTHLCSGVHSTTIVMAAVYYALSQILGRERFNRLFALSQISLLIGNQQEMVNPTELFSLFLQPVEKGDLLQIGDICCFPGVPFHEAKHPGEGEGGITALFAGMRGNKAFFHLPGEEQPVTEQHIQQEIIVRYNRERTPKDLSYIAKEMMSNRTLLYDRAKNGYLDRFYTVPSATSLGKKTIYRIRFSLMEKLFLAKDMEYTFLELCTQHQLQRALCMATTEKD